jgi:hypothetical protein
MLIHLALSKWYFIWPKSYEFPFIGYFFNDLLTLYMDCSAKVWSAEYSLSYLPALGTSCTGVFFPSSLVTVYSSDWIQLEREILLSFNYVFLLLGCMCHAYDAEARSRHSKKLYYLNVTFLNINKAFPYEKKLPDSLVDESSSTMTHHHCWCARSLCGRERKRGGGDTLRGLSSHHQRLKYRYGV